MSAGATPADPGALLRSRGYVALLVVASLVGVPISAAAYGFLVLVSAVQGWVFQDLPTTFGFAAPPWWWPIPVLAVAGIAVAAAIRYLPGRGGHVPAGGLETGGPPRPVDLVGIVLAALAGLGLGVVLGPEAPLIALGGGLATLALRPRDRAGNHQAVAILGAAGSFAAISALLGSPLLGAFLLMEASGLGGAMLGLVLVPGLLAAGIGALVFTGLGSWTGLGTFSLVLPSVPKVAHPTLAEFGWAIVIGAGAALLGTTIRRLAGRLAAPAQHRILVAGPIAGLAVAGLAVAYTGTTGHPNSDVLFSGQDALGPLLSSADSYQSWALVILVLFKGLAYIACLATLRGGPIFPSMFLGAAGGIALSHLPGLPMVAGAAMGIGALTTAMLRLPLTSVLLATLLLLSDGLVLMPVVIVAAVVSHVLSARWEPARPPVR